VRHPSKPKEDSLFWADPLGGLLGAGAQLVRHRLAWGF
jgi:hypothetical protein